MSTRARRGLMRRRVRGSGPAPRYCDHGRANSRTKSRPNRCISRVRACHLSQMLTASVAVDTPTMTIRASHHTTGSWTIESMRSLLLMYGVGRGSSGNEDGRAKSRRVPVAAVDYVLESGEECRAMREDDRAPLSRVS